MINGLVHPFRKKCESANWRWIRGQQLAPQGLGPIMDTTKQCNYGSIAPYTSPQVMKEMDAETPFRVWGYPNVTQCSKLAPLLYAPRVDPNPQKTCGGQCICGREHPQWPTGFFCGGSCPYR